MTLERPTAPCLSALWQVSAAQGADQLHRGMCVSARGGATYYRNTGFLTTEAVFKNHGNRRCDLEGESSTVLSSNKFVLGLGRSFCLKYPPAPSSHHCLLLSGWRSAQICLPEKPSITILATLATSTRPKSPSHYANYIRYAFGTRPTSPKFLGCRDFSVLSISLPPMNLAGTGTQ